MNTAFVPKSFLRWRAFRASSFVVTVAAFAAVVSSGYAQGTMTYTFPGAPSGALQQIGLYLAPGMEFNPAGVGNLFLSGAGTTGRPDNGSSYLYMVDANLSFSSPGNYFKLLSFDAAEFASSTSPVTLTVVGYPAMSSPVTNYFTLDGINDGTGPLQDFQTFFLDASFINLMRVDVFNVRWSLDNMVVSGVPEPTTGSLAMVGAGGAVAWSRFRRKHRHRQTHA